MWNGQRINNGQGQGTGVFLPSPRGFPHKRPGTALNGPRNQTQSARNYTGHSGGGMDDASQAGMTQASMNSPRSDDSTSSNGNGSDNGDNTVGSGDGKQQQNQNKQPKQGATNPQTVSDRRAEQEARQKHGKVGKRNGDHGKNTKNQASDSLHQ